jgi:predicted cupin superfamily sugar epimerase
MRLLATVGHSPANESHFSLGMLVFDRAAACRAVVRAFCFSLYLVARLAVSNWHTVCDDAVWHAARAELGLGRCRTAGPSTL